MPFQIHALPDSLFCHLFSPSDAELATWSARRVVVDAEPGFPCRVSLAEAEIGETVILVNYEHQPNETPYRSAHAIFVRDGAKQAFPRMGEVPEVLESRLISVRAFDRHHEMVAAEIVEGQKLAAAIPSLFENAEVDYLHLHNAKRGCFAASVTRA